MLQAGVVPLHGVAPELLDYLAVAEPERGDDLLGLRPVAGTARDEGLQAHPGLVGGRDRRDPVVDQERLGLRVELDGLAGLLERDGLLAALGVEDRKSTRLNSSH